MQRKNPYFNEPNRIAPKKGPRLIPINERPIEEQKEIRKKALESRIKNNKERRKMKEDLELLLQLASRDRDINHEFKKRGLPNPDMQTAMMYNLIQMATTQSKQAVSAATFVRDTVGEKPVEKQIQAQTDFESFIKNIEGDEF